MPVERRGDAPQAPIELEAFRSDIRAEVKEMNAAAIRHVEKIVAPFTDVPRRLAVVEEETTKQTPILEALEGEAKLAKKARIAAKAERITRSALDKDKRTREEQWDKTRKRIAGILALFVTLAEIVHYLLSK